jgi:DNA-binding winged helix-turn-helix (wHTH) protein/tetratricopeptide (TPR) repeat protein
MPPEEADTRATTMEQQTQVTAGDLQIDLRGHRVVLGGREVNLTAKEYELLRHLAEHPGWVWSQQQLLEAVWGYEFGSPRVVVVHVANLRRKLEAVLPQSRFVETVRGVGYRFEAWSATPGDQKKVATPLGPATFAAQPDSFVGREPECEALRQALDTAVSGTGQLVAVGGDIGIGKTRLAEEFAKEAATQGIRVVWGLCREQGASPWEPWPEIIEACVSMDGVSVDAKRAQQLLLGAPEQEYAAGAESGTRPEGDRECVIRSIAQVLNVAAKRRPLAIVLEDIHWADASSLLCLQHLCSSAQSQRLLVLATYRDFEVERLPRLRELIASVARAGGRTLVLRPLARAEVARFIAQGSYDRSPPLVDDVYQVTAGNPFFVKELLRLVALRQGDPSVLSELPLQEGVRHVIGRRIGTLSPDCVRLLELASVIGVRFPVQLAQSASGLPLDRCDSLLDEAQNAQVLRAAGLATLMFCHQLVRDVVYLGLSGSRRARLHARVGNALEVLWAFELDVHAAELAHHFANSVDPHYAAKAFFYSIMAGHTAGSRYAWEDSAYWLQRALELRVCYPTCTLQPPELAALYEELGDAQFESGHVEQAADAFQDALRSDPEAAPIDMGRRYRKLGGVLVLTPRVTRATLAYLEAERVMGEPAPDKPEEWWEEWLGMELERCWGHYYAAEFAGLVELAQQIRPFVDSRGTAAHRGALYNCLWIGEHGAHRYVTTEKGLEYAQMSLEAYFADGRLRSKCEGEWVISLALLWLPEHPDEAETHLRRFLTLSEEYGDITFQMEARWGLAMWHRWHGHVERVREHAEKNLALDAGRNVACYAQSAKGSLAWVAHREGDFELARRLASEALAKVEHDEEHAFAYQWLIRWPLIGVHLAAGEMEEAAAHARALLDPGQQAMPGPLEESLTHFVAKPKAATGQATARLARQHGYL